MAARRELVLWLLVIVALAGGVGVAIVTVRAVERPLTRLVAVAERYGGGDLRPLLPGRMPRELQQLADAIVITSYSIHYTKLYEGRGRRTAGRLRSAVPQRRPRSRDPAGRHARGRRR